MPEIIKTLNARVAVRGQVHVRYGTGPVHVPWYNSTADLGLEVISSRVFVATRGGS